LKISEVNNLMMLSLKGKTAGHSKEEGSDMTKVILALIGKDSGGSFHGKRISGSGSKADFKDSLRIW